MRRLSIFKAFALSAAVAFVATSCLKESDDTLILPVPDGTIPTNVIPAEVLETITGSTIGMHIYEGVKPPVMFTDTIYIPNGTDDNGNTIYRTVSSAQFVCSPELLVYSSDNKYQPGDRFDDTYFAFVGQSNANIVQYYEREGSSFSYAKDAQITGDGDNFTIYFYEDGIFNDGKTFSKATIISGTWSEDGIKDYEICFLMLDKQDSNGDLMHVNHYRVCRDGDGVASKCHWLNGEMIK
ncbi:MAG: hypothetical protein IJU81_09330 [Bacteroidales bacterium]|nr:hypothetical protein [Bacteroidales bacterium]